MIIEGMDVMLPAAGTDTAVYLIGNDLPDGRYTAAICRVDVPDWNACLSPWPAAPCFKNGEAFSGGADAFLEKLIRRVYALNEKLGIKKAYIAGYSLAGLFALYSVFNTGVFAGVAAMSPSVWFEGWDAYISSGEPAVKKGRYYLSVGRKELLTRNPVMSRLGSGLELTRNRLSLFSAEPVPLVLQNGGHYTEPERRVAEGISYLIS